MDNFTVEIWELEDAIFIGNEDQHQLICDFVSNLTPIAEKNTLLSREKLNEEKYSGGRHLFPAKDDAPNLFECEADDDEDENLEIQRLRTELKM